MTAPVTIVPVTGIPEVTAGTDLGAAILTALAAADEQVLPGDLLVVTSKVVSKTLDLALDPARADRAALVLAESSRVVSERRTGTGLTRVVAAHAGPVLAGAGIDASNTGATDRLLLLPRDPDAAAAQVRDQLLAAGAPRQIGVLLSDTAGRPWRAGLTDFALGLSGICALEDLRETVDADGRPMAVTVRCPADELAAAADLVKGKAAGVPVALIRGLPELVDPTSGDRARDLVRSGPEDWFALGRAEAVRDALGIAPGSADSERVGIESVHPEPLLDRITRAVAVALHDGLSPDVALDVGPSGVEVSGSDGYQVGRVTARLEAALICERLHFATSRTASGSALSVTD